MMSSVSDFDPFAPLPTPPTLYYRSLPAPFAGHDLEVLRAMRISCGLYEDRIPRWSQEVQRDQRRMYFIYLTDPHIFPLAVPIGMVSLNLFNSDDLSLANFSATGRVEVSSLFIYQAYRHLGVGMSAMMEMERRAAEIGAYCITLNSLATSRNLQLYNRLGYREFKPRSNQSYAPQDILGTGLGNCDAMACFMEKPLC